MGNKTSRETLKRQWLLLNRISNKRKGTRFFQDALKEEGLEVSLRTIQRDLNDLSIYFPLQSDEEKIAGWRWAEGARIFDIPGMDSHAALVFKMIRLHLEKMLPVSCLKLLQPYFQKAEIVLNEKTAGAIKWPQKIARISRYLTLEPPEIKQSVLDAVYEGLLLEKQLEISYKNRGNGETENASIHPLGLVHVDNVAYLVCTFWNYDDLRQLALHRINSASLLDDWAQIPSDFKLEEYIDRGSFGFPESEDFIRLKCLFDKQVAIHLEESPLVSGQTITEYSEDCVLMSAEIKDTSQLRWWLLGFGDLVTVLEPAGLREEIKKTLAGALKQYGLT